MADQETDEVVGMISVDPNDKESTVLVVSEKGSGKRSSLDDYRITNRGGKGVKTISVTDKTGHLSTIKYVSEDDDLMITTKEGVIIRIDVADLRVMGRATQGVKVIKVDEGDEISDITVVAKAEESSTPEGVEAEEGAESAEGVETQEGAETLTSPEIENDASNACLLYTSPSPRDATLSRMPSSA